MDAEAEAEKLVEEMKRNPALLEAVAKAAVVARDTLETDDRWHGGASTREAANDARWRLRRALEAAGFEITTGEDLDWRGSLVKECNDAGFYLGRDGLMHFDPTAPEHHEPGEPFLEGRRVYRRIYGNAVGPTLKDVAASHCELAAGLAKLRGEPPSTFVSVPGSEVPVELPDGARTTFTFDKAVAVVPLAVARERMQEGYGLAADLLGAVRDLAHRFGQETELEKCVSDRPGMAGVVVWLNGVDETGPVIEPATGRIRWFQGHGAPRVDLDRVEAYLYLKGVDEGEPVEVRPIRKNAAAAGVPKRAVAASRADPVRSALERLVNGRGMKTLGALPSAALSGIQPMELPEDPVWPPGPLPTALQVVSEVLAEADRARKVLAETAR